MDNNHGLIITEKDRRPSCVVCSQQQAAAYIDVLETEVQTLRHVTDAILDNARITKNDWTITASANHLNISNHGCTFRVPMVVLLRFAEYYLDADKIK